MLFFKFFLFVKFLSIFFIKNKIKLKFLRFFSYFLINHDFFEEIGNLNDIFWTFVNLFTIERICSYIYSLLRNNFILSQMLSFLWATAKKQTILGIVYKDFPKNQTVWKTTATTVKWKDFSCKWKTASCCS